MKKQLGPLDLLFPAPVMLVVSGIGDNANIMTVVWGSIVSGKPPTIGIAVHKNRYSLQLIRENKEFTVNIPSKDIVSQADYCGLVSGNKTNKFMDTGLTAIDGSIVKTPLIKECPYNMECKVTQEVEVGDWILVLGEIVETYLDENKLVQPKRISPDYAQIQPLSYFGNAREYRSIGEKCGEAFSIGKSIKR
ncbi:MAG: flavin reductase family protein [Pelosinus sp.]|nr:flavin reductase family protein [Pelosinus sp.]